jgi:hypothetical protein
MLASYVRVMGSTPIAATNLRKQMEKPIESATDLIDPFEDDEPIEGCSLENPEICESCQ